MDPACDRWLALVARAAEPFRVETARAVCCGLLDRYTAADRRYHDLRHILACLQQLDSVRDLAQHVDWIELAIWFHDAVYDTRRSDNEEASARMAIDTLVRLNIPAAVGRAVSNLIFATRHNSEPADSDAALLADIDLAILGQPGAVFDEYEAGIRFEYAWVSDGEFRAGRSKVLRHFLDRPRIYATVQFKARFETSARENLVRSLAKLEAGV